MKPHTLAFGLMACALDPVAAEETKRNASDAVALKPLVVTATRTEKPVDALPPSVTSTDRQTLDRNLIRDFTDFARRAEPGVDITRQPRYGAGNLAIRGLEGNRVLVLVDGIRLPDSFAFKGRDAMVGQDLVDFDSLSAIDVVRGPGSTLYGSSALGGIVGLRTLSPADLLAGGKRFAARLATDYDSADTSTGARATLAGEIAADTLWLLQLGARKEHELGNRGRQDGGTSARTLPDPQSGGRRNALVKLQHDFGSGHVLAFSGEYREAHRDSTLLSDIGAIDPYYPGGPSPGTVQSSRASDTQTRQRIALGYDYSAESEHGIDSASARLYWQSLDSDQRRFQVRDTAADYRRDGQYRETMHGANGQLVANVLGPLRQQWVVGGEWWQSRTSEFAGGRPASPQVNARDIPLTIATQWGAFAQDELFFGNGRFSLMPGLRYDAYRQDPYVDAVLAAQIAANAGVMPQSQSDDKFSPKLLATWKATPGVTVFAQYAEGFRAPSATEVNGQFKNSGNYILLANPTLKPESSAGVEIGVRLGHGALGGSFTAYDTRYANFIEQLKLPASDPAWQAGYRRGVFQNRNIGRVRIYGAEASAHWRFRPHWQTRAALAWAVGTDENRNAPLDSIAPLKGVFGVGYVLEHGGIDATLSASLAKRRVAEDTRFKPPGYGVVDLNGWWAPQKNLRLSAGLFNLFDKKYWDALDRRAPRQGAGPGQALDAGDAALERYTQPGRSLRAGLDYRF